MSLETLQAEINEIGHYNVTPDYFDRMVHDIPEAPVVERMPFILERCKGKNVLNLGCASGSLHEEIKKIAKSVYGVDKVQPCDYLVDLDDYGEDRNNLTRLGMKKYDIIICGEILEHIANTGDLIGALKWMQSPVIITVPNAFSLVQSHWLKVGKENVNIDHVAWYSYTTFKTLVERYGFKIKEFAWYKGKPIFAEGMIFVIE